MSIPSSASSTRANAGVEANDIRGLKPLETFEYPFYYYAGAAALALLAGAFLYWLFRRLRSHSGEKSNPKTLPAEPPDVVAIRRLQELKHPLGVDLRQTHFQLSEIFRDYLEGRYAIPASDWTTEEILASLDDDAVRKILTETDGVKFAGTPTDHNATTALIDAAIDFVTKTRKAPEPPGAVP